MANRHDQQSFSESGNITITSASGNKTGNFCAIQVVGTANATFTTLVDAAERTGGVGASTVTYAPGVAIYGQFTSVTVNAGTVRLTYASPVC